MPDTTRSAPATTTTTTATTTERLLQDLAARAASDEWDTLPPQVYSSDEIWQLELERVFRPGWANVGHVSEIPAPGDYKAVDVVGEPMVMTRDRHGDIHVVSRVCTHRWMDICGGPGRGSTPSLQCPYHKWTFGLEGGLRAAPEMDKTPGFERADFGLHTFRHEIWEGFVFVNVDGDAPSTADIWAPLKAELSPFGLSDWTIAHSITWGECAWDWKVFLDNGECYHHIGIHHDTLEALVPARLAVDADDNGTYALTHARVAPEFLVDDGVGGRDYPSDDPGVPGLTDLQRTSLTLVHPFPNYVIALTPQSAIWFEVHPLGPGRLHLTTHILLPPHLADAPGLDERIAGHVQTLEAVHRQDIEVCEGVQRGVSSTVARRGMLCHLERHNRTFARWYATQMTR